MRGAVAIALEPWLIHRLLLFTPQKPNEATRTEAGRSKDWNLLRSVREIVNLELFSQVSTNETQLAVQARREQSLLRTQQLRVILEAVDEIRYMYVRSSVKCVGRGSKAEHEAIMVLGSPKSGVAR